MAEQKARPRLRLFKDASAPAAGPPWWTYVLLFTLCVATGYWSVERYHSVVLWPANGVLLAAVLMLHKRDALRVLAACLAINIASNALRADPPLQIFLNAALNQGEVLLAALLARRFCGATLDLRRPTRLARFAFLALAPAVAVSAVIGVSFLPIPSLGVYLQNMQYWFTIEMLGYLCTTPILMLMARHKRFDRDDAPLWQKAALIGALAAVTTAVFMQTAAPVMFLVFLPLLAVSFRLQPHWAAGGVLVVAVIASAFSLNGIGPATLGHVAPLWPQNEAALPVLNVLPVLHLFLSATLIVAFAASTILTERRMLERRLHHRTGVAQTARAKAEAAERRVTHIALHDSDTGLFNRLGLEAEVAGMLEARGGRCVYVAALGIDRFASVRTAIGSSLSAALIAETAHRLAGRLPQVSIARLTSGTLGVALRARSIEEAEAKLAAARESFAEAIAIGASRVDVRLTVGLAAAPEHAQDARTLVERAQIALDQAYLGKKEMAVFDAAAERVAAGGLTLLSELRDGLSNGSVWLAHQPKLDLRSGEITSVECLIRWTHPEQGPIPPDAFIPLVEETGFIGALTDWALDRALEEQAWLDTQGMCVAVAVNISARNLSEQGFADRLIATALKRAADPSRVTLEITETAVIGSPEVALENLEALKRAGFAIAIDDYGSGMSSLAYLKRIPADELKIDSAFIRQLTANSHDAVLVRSTIDLGHSLGLRVVAEGVEEQEALDLLGLFGCDIAQGYLIARPMPVTILAETFAPKAAPKTQSAVA